MNKEIYEITFEDIVKLFQDYGLTKDDMEYNYRCAEIANQINYNYIFEEMKEVDKCK